MISIALQNKGDRTTAACAYEKGGDTLLLEITHKDGATALNRLIGRLARAQMAGAEWAVREHPELRGVVPGYPFRKRAGAPVQLALPWA